MCFLSNIQFLLSNEIVKVLFGVTTINWRRGRDPWQKLKLVMATLLGKLEEFDPASDSITAYVERVQLFFDANSVAEGKQVAVFLSVLGSKTYLLLRNLLTPETPKDKTFDELVTVLKEHFEPKPLIISERFHFYRREQAVNESTSDYVVELRRLTTHLSLAHFWKTPFEIGSYVD